ncbi:uncharacterized protein LOC144467539, partial [Augochlora pura]
PPWDHVLRVPPISPANRTNKQTNKIKTPSLVTKPKKSNPLCLVLPPGQLAGSGASDEFRCEPCNKILTSLTRLKRHIQNVHTRPSKEPICNVCKRVYSSLNSLRNHKSIYHRQLSKNEQQRKKMEQMREREQREHTERPSSHHQPHQQQQQQQQQQYPDYQQQPRLG